MKYIYFLLTLSIFNLSYAQCTSEDIPRDNWLIHSFDTQEENGEGANNGRAIHAIDGNQNTFWHTQWQNFTASFPHFIAIDMGQSYAINGISFTTRFDSANNKVKDYELYLSNDGENWGAVQSAGFFTYPDHNASGQLTSIQFGAVEARYFKLEFLSAYDRTHAVISELYATEIGGDQDCIATGQNNQVLLFEEIETKYATDEPFSLEASINSELPIYYEVLSGPATIEDNILSLNGTGGNVEVRAYNNGNEDFYGVEQFQSFEVIDLRIIEPELHTHLIESLPVEMPSLYAYELNAYATIEEDNQLSISEIKFFANGEELESSGIDNNFSAWWTPAYYGEHSIEIIAYASNGNQTSSTKTITVVPNTDSQMVSTLEDAVIDWGSIGSQWYYGTYELPQFVGAYDEIIADFIVSCPDVNGGCDDWDRLAYVQIKDHNGDWIELFRYITPYGVACDHSIDVTDYASLLQGKVEFRVYIETWGTGGWQMDLILNYIAGTPDYLYTKVEEAWQGNYSFGDPANLQPVPTVDVSVPTNTEAATFRLVTTGHGWGQNNTSNAAEFYYATHNLKVDGTNTFTQEMEVDCNPNPDGCTGQQGTWYYNRAGWCPGTIPSPYMYDLTEYITEDFTFTYEFQPSYTDFCHPNNPNCVSGSTCPDCNDGYNPYYRIGGYFIYKGNSPLNTLKTHEVVVDDKNSLMITPNPSNGLFKVQLDTPIQKPIVQIYNVAGESLKTYFFDSYEDFSQFHFNLQHIPTGVYFIKVYNTTESIAGKLLLK